MADELQAALDKADAQAKRDRDANQATLPGPVAAVASGLTFGFADEAVAGARSLFGNTPYSEALAQERASKARFAEEHPVLSFGAEMAGGVPLLWVPGLGQANEARIVGAGLQTAGRVGQAARTAGKAGAIQGGLSGAGEGEGVVGRLTGAALGSTLGAGLGAAGGAVVEAATPLVRGAKNLVVETLNPGAGARRQAAEIAAKDAASRSRPVPDEIAAEELAQRNGLPPTGRTYGEVLGPNARATQDNLATLPGDAMAETTRALQARREARGERIGQAIDQTFGQGPDAYTRRQQLYTERSNAANPLYEQVRNNSNPLGPEDMQLWERGGPARGDANRIAQMAGSPVRDGQPPTVSDMLNLKKGLDDLIEREIRNGAGRNSNVSIEARRLRDQVVDRLDTLTTDQNTGRSTYREARTAWAGPSAHAEALDLGRNLYRESAPALREHLARMTDTEREHFVFGATDQIKQKLREVRDTGSANPINAIAGSEANRDKLLVLTEAMGLSREEGQRRWRQLVDYIERENQGHQHEVGVLNNSRTAQRQNVKDMLLPPTLGAAIGAAGGLGTGNDVGTGAVVGALATGGYRNATSFARNRANAELGRILGIVDPAQQRATNAAIEILQAQQRQRLQGVNPNVIARTGLLAGEVVGNPVREGILGQ